MTQASLRVIVTGNSSKVRSHSLPSTQPKGDRTLFPSTVTLTRSHFLPST
ncbi:MAG: hypothetical protein RID53_26260 [Coleofasciculus sp. B1-GNL1-01]